MTRERLMRPGQLAALAAALLAILAVLRPPGGAFEQPAWVDDLTAAYLRGLLWIRPRDEALRLRLARQLLDLGRPAEAGRALGEVAGLSARLLRLDIERAAGAPPGALLAMLHPLVGEALPPGEVERLVGVALGLAQPAIAASLYGALAARTGEPRWSARAAELALASGQPLEAGRHFARAADRSADGAAPALAAQALAALVAAGAGGEALSAARRFLVRFPEDAALRRQARDLALGLGLLDEAVAHGRALLALLPGDSDARAWLAQTAEWARRPALALREWAELARRAQPEQFPALTARASRLAQGLGEHRLLASLHEEEARRGRLSAAGLDGLLWAHERLGTSDRAAAVLDAYVGRHPGDGQAWRALGRLRERLGDRDGARRAWAALRALRPDEEALVHEARLLAEDGQRARARALLRGAPPLPAVLALRGELAWEDRDDGEALAAYRTTWRARAATAVQAERLLRVLVRLDMEEELLAAAAVELAEGRRAPVLGALEEAVERGRPVLAARTGAAPPLAGDLFTRLERLARPYLGEEPRLWLLRGRWEQQQGRRAGARAAYERALALAPALGPAQQALLWLLIEERDLSALRKRLVGWRAVAEMDRGLWFPFAVGCLLLGAPRESVSWFAREWPARADDPIWLRGFAEALEGAGRADAGHRLRRLAARRDAEAVARAPLAGAARGDAQVAGGVPSDAGRERSPRAPAGPDLVRAGVDSLHIGPLHIVQGLAGLRRALGPVGLELRVTPAYLAASAATAAEVDVDLRAQLQWRWGRSELGAGANLRTDGSVPRLFLGQQIDLRSLLLRAELALGEIASDTAALRLGAARRRLGVLVRADLTRRLYGLLLADLRAHHDRTGAALGQGYSVAAEVGYRLLLSRPALHLRLTGAWMQNRLAPSLPVGLAALLPPGAAPGDVLPPLFGMAGAGLALGCPATVPGDRIRCLVELWLGGLWPQQSLGYAARLGVGLPLPGGAELSLGAHLANNQMGGLGAATWGFGARYLKVLGRTQGRAAQEVPLP